MFKFTIKALFLFFVAAALFYFLNLEFGHSILPEDSYIKLDLNQEKTLEEQVGQIFIVGFEGKEPAPETLKFINELRPGGVLLLARNIENKEQIKRLIRALQEESLRTTGLPLLVAVDQEGGEVCRLHFLDCAAPHEIQDENQAFELGKKRGKELLELGANLNLAPVLDQAFGGDFIYGRTFQVPLDKAARLAKAFIQGQREGGILNAAKHFPGYGRINFNPERVILPTVEFLPQSDQFALLSEQSMMPSMLMMANVVYKEHSPDLPFSFTKEGILMARRAIGKNGFVISDDLSSPVLKNAYGLENTVKKVYAAGADLFIVAGFDEPGDPALAISYLKKSFQDGLFSHEELEQKINKIIKLKQGL